VEVNDLYFLGLIPFHLYKLMIGSSESLIQRRQKTNAFFITVIGSLLAIVGLLVKTGVINSGSFGILYGFSVVGLLFCNSWRNLIDNYGKLNKAKFDVILRLEKEFGAQIYSAEWIALYMHSQAGAWERDKMGEFHSVPFILGQLQRIVSPIFARLLQLMLILITEIRVVF
jgi:hypothetical protein